MPARPVDHYTKMDQTQRKEAIGGHTASTCLRGLVRITWMDEKERGAV
jgi:hypothetical protein